MDTNNIMILAIVVTSLATFLSRFLGALTSEKVSVKSKVFQWFNCVAYSTLAALLGRMIIFPAGVLSAEVLQVTSSSVLQIGDHNRNYKVRIACINVDDSKGQEAIAWLKSELPRHTKVNFFPKGSEDGMLLARVIALKSGKDLASGMVELGYANSIC